MADLVFGKVTFTTKNYDVVWDEVPRTFAERVETLIRTAFEELVDEGIIDFNFNYSDGYTDYINENK